VSVNQKTGVPQKIIFDIKGNKGEIIFNQCNSNAIAREELFVEPESAKNMEVKQENLDRIFASFINHALEMTR
jgi:hypothetical protein